MRGVYVAQLRTAEACACWVPIPTMKIKHCSAGLGVFAGMTSQQSENTGSYYVTLVYHDLFSGKHTRKLYGYEALYVDLVRFSRYALQNQVRGGPFEWGTKSLGSKRAISKVQPIFMRVLSSTTFFKPEKTRKLISTRVVCR